MTLARLHAHLLSYTKKKDWILSLTCCRSVGGLNLQAGIEEGEGEGRGEGNALTCDGVFADGS